MVDRYIICYYIMCSNDQHLFGSLPAREEQYRIMWTELETFLRANCRTDQHNRVLNCLLECRNKTDDEKKDDKVELDQALRELDQ
jgi:Cell cycle and development regulator.